MSKYQQPNRKSIWLGVGIICLLLAVLFVNLGTPQGLADAGQRGMNQFWQAKAEDARVQLAKESTDLDSLFMLAMAQAMLGEVEESMETFKALDRLGAGDSYAQTVIDRFGDKQEYRQDLLIQSYLAFAYYVESDYPSSVEAFNVVNRLDPENPWPLNYQGFSLYKCGRLDEAVTALKKSVRLDPSNQYSHMLLGLAYYESGHPFKALAELSKAPKVIGKFFR